MLRSLRHVIPHNLYKIINSYLYILSLHDCTFGGRPYIYQEVIDRFSDEAIKPSDYFNTGDVTEFKFCDQIALLAEGKAPAAGFEDFASAPNWRMMPSQNALVFVANHDNQRNHGGGGDILTYKDPMEYRKGLAFGLAWDYGTARVMSSYMFNNSDEGPPSDDDGNTNTIVINDDGMCEDGWVCEHRWRSVRNMACFRNIAAGEPMQNWWDNGNGFIAFSRGDKTFFAFSQENDVQSQTLQTGLPPGTYCDLISGEPTSDGCSGTSIDVDDEGMAVIEIAPSTENKDAMIALTIAATAGRDDYNGCIVTAADGAFRTMTDVHLLLISFALVLLHLKDFS